MLVINCTAVFLEEGNAMMGWNAVPTSSLGATTTNWQFCSAFRVNPLLCHHLWNTITINQNPINASVQSVRPKHLLWTLLFLKQYNSTEMNAGICSIDEKTYRKWVWIFVTFLLEFKVVSNLCISNFTYLYIYLTYKFIMYCL